MLVFSRKKHSYLNYPRGVVGVSGLPILCVALPAGAVPAWSCCSGPSDLGGRRGASPGKGASYRMGGSSALSSDSSSSSSSSSSRPRRRVVVGCVALGGVTGWRTGPARSSGDVPGGISCGWRCGCRCAVSCGAVCCGSAAATVAAASAADSCALPSRASISAWAVPAGLSQGLRHQGPTWAWRLPGLLNQAGRQQALSAPSQAPRHGARPLASSIRRHACAATQALI